MLNRLKKKIVEFSERKSEIPILAAFASGLYPILYYYNKNFLMANSWEHIIWFASRFIIMPIIVFKLTTYAISKIKLFHFFKVYTVTGLNLLFFGIFMLIITYGFNKFHGLIIGVLSFILMFVVYKHIRKIVILQFIMATLSLITFVPKLIKHLNHTDEWLLISDNIKEVKFKTKPNIYLIQPDGYINFSEIGNDYYKYDNDDFKSYLRGNEFKLYPNFRSNYFSTLTSNASMFAMKHHYFLSPNHKNYSFYDFRKVLAGDNSVVQILKSNDYKTFLLLDSQYLVINRPENKVDYINNSYEEIAYLGNKWSGEEPLKNLEKLINSNKSTSNFFFIEKILPTHIENLSKDSRGVEGERLDYINRLEKGNIWLKRAIEIITSNDKNAIIILAADHGGYVGLEFAEQVFQKTEDSQVHQSIFSSILAIKWPNNEAPEFDDKFKSSVNLFRILFAHLSENKKYLNNLEEDKSYQVIEKKAPFGVYELLDKDGNPVFKNISEKNSIN